MIQAIKEFIPSSLYRLTIPQGGMFLFLYLPFLTGKMTSFELFELLAKKEELICLSGDEFFVPSATVQLLTEEQEQQRQTESEEAHQSQREQLKQRLPTLRLTYAAATPAQIRVGIEKLGKCLSKLSQGQEI